MIFVNEFSDLLHESLPMEVILEHFRVFEAASWHQFQILTKRAERLADLNSAILNELGSWPENVWMGVSVCSAAKIESRRIGQLGSTRAVLKWISFEPWVSDMDEPLRDTIPNLSEILRENAIAWVVVGGESGSRNDTNLMTLDDVRFLITASKAAGCRTHFKQLGTALAIQLGVYSTRGQGQHRAKGGNPNQWPHDLKIREWPTVNRKSAVPQVRFQPAYFPNQWLRFPQA